MKPDPASMGYVFVSVTVLQAESRLAAIVMQDGRWSTGVTDALAQRDAWLRVLDACRRDGMLPKEE